MSVEHAVKRRGSPPRAGGGRGMSGAFAKDTVRSWAHAWKRFFSIAVISMLGVAVLTGIYAGCRDMFLAADRFYDAQGLHDIQVLSTYGLTDDDVTALRRVEGVATVQPEHTQAVTALVKGTEKNVTMTELGRDGLDLPYVQDGRLPRKAGEVAVTEKFLKDSGLAIGDRLTVTPESDTDDAAAGAASVPGESAPTFPTKLTIVGRVLDPKDLTNPDGYSTAAFRSPGTADYVFFAPSAGVKGDVYTAISLSVEGAAGLDTFGDDYDAAVDEVADRIEHTVQTPQQKARRQTIVNAAQRTLDEAKEKATGQIADGQRQLDDQRAELERNKQTLADSKAQLEAQRTQLADGETQLAQGRAQLADARTQIAQGRKQIDNARAQLDAGNRQLADARSQLDGGLAQVTSGLAQLDQGIAQIDQMLPLAEQAQRLLKAIPSIEVDPADWRQIADLLGRIGIPADPDNPPGTALAGIRTQVDTLVSGMQAQRLQLEAQRNQLTATKQQLDEQNAQLTAKEQEAAAGQDELNRQSAALEQNAATVESQAAQLESQAALLTAGRQQLDAGLKQIEDGEAQLKDGEAQLDDAQRQLDDQRTKATKEFAKQQQTIDDIAAAQWYVQTRDSIGGFSALDSDVSSIQSLGLAFPVMFLLVAVLMSLTTMTRMVEEERGLIGTYVGLGYGSGAIAWRYLLFALLACLIGGGVGLLVGFLGIPAFLLLVLKDMYVIPDIRLEYNWLTGTGGILLFVVGVLAATAVACAGELRQTPAALMRPKAPKAGSRVLLERIKPLWRRLGFLNKVTVRNIFRFKSRLIMTVGGVAGCTALIVCGLAINDSVDTIGPKQYEDIYQYDMLVVAADDRADQMRAKVRSDGQTTETLDLRVENGEMQNDAGSSTVQLTIVSTGGGAGDSGDSATLGDMVRLADATTRRPLSLGADDVIVEQSAAKALGVKAGDTVNLTDGQMRHGEAEVTAVTRNLVGAGVYLGEEAYRRIFGVADGVEMTPNAVMAKLRGDADERMAYVERLGRSPAVLNATSCDDLQASFTFELMGAVVGLIVALAGSLALVVLFTLANTNVSERVREMATLKVLGFYDREVHTYVNKEMLILTGAGVVVGLPLGHWIGGLLTSVLNMPSIYFEVEVHWWSYLIAAAATMVFALLVTLLTNPVLDRIDPAVSLKSVE
ncbi:FtsX-like permease family protein [Bifidobacterium pullorum subsp. saeculare]|uniref:FtsX-like permease family protein n=1 Tax=Bifidobacterium pullorum subsp. saeculare TaxID=78257 RepID=A0A938WYP7_9BIFI|nr:FtsX-like permease family protein [Bifidobacterium pullorum]MBM6700301.1 FtsX-like permease family protein [Bifidobacterium pullorum subsp. saeculare]